MKSYLGYELTDWYPPHIKPVRKGLYIVGSDKLSVMMTWNGRYWVNGMGNRVDNDVGWRGVVGEKSD